jgi:hypothetical protein
VPMVCLPVRTNNQVDSSHKQFKLRVMISHPSMFVFLNHLRTLANDFMLEISNLRRRRRIQRQPRRRQRNNDERIRNRLYKYSSGRYPEIDFSSAVSHCAGITVNLQDYTTIIMTQIKSVAGTKVLTVAANTGNAAPLT